MSTMYWQGDKIIQGVKGERAELGYVGFDQYFGQNLGRPVSDRAIVTKVLVIGAGFFQATALG